MTFRTVLIPAAILIAGCQNPNNRTNPTPETPADRPPAEMSRDEQDLKRTCEQLFKALENGDVRFQWEHLSNLEKTDPQGKTLTTFESFTDAYVRNRDQIIRESKGANVRKVTVSGTSGDVLVKLGTGEMKVQTFLWEGETWKYYRMRK